MKNNKFYYKRLLKLANHLVGGQLINQYIPVNLSLRDSPIMEIEARDHITFFTFVFREIAEINPDVSIFQRNNKECHPFYIADFYGLEPRETFHLFAPCLQDPNEFGGHRLPFDATPEQIGKNIHIFLRKDKNMMINYNEREVVVALIMDHMVHLSLVGRLNALDLYNSKHCSQLGDKVFDLMGLDNAPEQWYENYLKKITNAQSENDNHQYYSVAWDMYHQLCGKRRELNNKS